MLQAFFVSFKSVFVLFIFTLFHFRYRKAFAFSIDLLLQEMPRCLRGIFNLSSYLRSTRVDTEFPSMVKVLFPISSGNSPASVSCRSRYCVVVCRS